MGRPPGWRDAELHALLGGLRAAMMDYIYAPDDVLAARAQHALPDKEPQEVIEFVRELMQSFATVLSTRAFRSEALLVDGTTVYLHEHLYETMLSQAENRRAGVWHPDELRRFLVKINNYRKDLDKSHDVFFSRIQIWSKSVADMRAKFYLLREIYLEEKKRSMTKALTESEVTRLRVLESVYIAVPPPAPPVGEFLPVAPPALGKHSFHRLWTPAELKKLTECLVEITLDVQTKGTSPLVEELPAILGRTDQSCINKLIDMQERYLKKSTYFRAAHLPDVIYDETSVAHKIFNANWSDHTDPYAAGIVNLKSYLNRVLSSRQRSKRVAGGSRPPPLRMEMRKRECAVPLSNASTAESQHHRLLAVTPTRDGHGSPGEKSHIHPVLKSVASSTWGSSSAAAVYERPPPVLYSDFVHECATLLKWDPALTLDVCVEMHKLLRVYQGGQSQVFFNSLSASVNGVAPCILICAGEIILNHCQKRYGSLDMFCDAVRGIESVAAARASAESDMSSLPTTTPGPTQGKDHGSIPGDGSPLPPSLPLKEGINNCKPNDAASDDQTSTATTSRPSTIGKSNAKTQSMIQAKWPTQAASALVDSSPSVQHSSPDDYQSDEADDGLADEEDDGDTRSIASSDVGSFGSISHSKSDHFEPLACRAASKYHVSSKKTIIVKQAALDHCCLCCRHSRRRVSASHLEHELCHYEPYGRRRHRWARSDDERFERMFADCEYESGIEDDSGVGSLEEMWSPLMAPIDARIKELESRRQEHLELKEDRLRRERKKQWKEAIRAQVTAECANTTDPQ